MIKITQMANCTGCSACKSICPQNCITMEGDFEGFLYPKIDGERCIDCGLCEKVCPIMNNKEINNTPKAYACYNKNEKVRMESSSGALFTLIAEQIIDNSGMVFGASFDREFNVIHDFTEAKEGLHRYRGSKYVQSTIGDTHRQAKAALIKGRKVLFIGTPCQIAGFQAYLQRDYENLLCLDIICHGVPSPKVWHKYISYQEKSFNSSISKINFRNKELGWKNYCVSILFEDNSEYKKEFSQDLYMKAFLKDICLRPSCYQCKYKSINRLSDITLGDFWGIQNLLPEMDDDRGTSLIFANSKNGQAILDSIKDKLLYKEVDINQATAYNPSAIKSSANNPNRVDFLKKIDLLQFDNLVKKYCNDSFVVRAKRKIVCIKKKIKRMLHIG